MLGRTNTGGSGAALNLKVVGGISRPGGSDTLTWDGNTEGLVCAANYFYKVSDAAPTMTDFANGATLIFNENGEIAGIPIAVDDIYDMSADGVPALMDTKGGGFIVVFEDNVVVDGWSFPEKGIYFANYGAEGFTTSFTIPGYSFGGSTVKENTVWVNTDTAINGYAFSATAPTNPVEGMVWFDVGTDSTASMNVDKKNTVMLYPTACKQYVNGSWATRNVAVYLNDAWVTLKTYYFKAGEGQQVAFSKGSSTNSSVTVTTSKVSIYRNTAEDAGHGTYWLTTDKHSLAGKTRLVFRAKCTENFSDTTNAWRGRFLVLASRLTSVAAPQDLGITEYASITPTASSTKNYVIDVSNLNGSYSIGWWGCGTVEIYDFYSE